MGVHFDRFSGSLSELPKGKRTIKNALRVLSADPRVSTFERGDQWLDSLLLELRMTGLVVEDMTEPYPWHRFDLTDKARAMLKGADDR